MRKYRNTPTHVDGIRFDSKREARHYGTLKLREAAGEISGLKIQPKYVFDINGVRVGSYTPDFSYIENGKGVVVEDVKSPATARDSLYRFKKKLMKAWFGVDVVDVL